jgi:hypothetical protein
VLGALDDDRMKSLLMVMVVGTAVTSAERAARAAERGLTAAGLTLGPELGLRSVAGARSEWGGEVGLWWLCCHKSRVPGAEPIPLGLDVALTNRTTYAELEAAWISDSPPPLWFVPGISLGAAWVWAEHRLEPQATFWIEPTVGRQAAPLPIVPYARLTGVEHGRRAWQIGLMLKILIGART